MKRVLIALLLVAGCSDGDQPADESAVAGGIDTTTLAGLYEGGDAARPNQMCIFSEGEVDRFGIVVWGADMHSCSGAGEAVREGASLRLAMAGDESCTIEATIVDGKVTLPTTVPEGCSYYCGAKAQLGSASFAKVGDTAEDALKARDLVGEPLCPAAAEG